MIIYMVSASFSAQTVSYGLLSGAAYAMHSNLLTPYPISIEGLAHNKLYNVQYSGQLVTFTLASLLVLS